MEMMAVIARTVFFYFFIVLAYRLMGKREVGQLGVIDLIVSILIAEIVAISIENKTDSIFFAILPISILVLLEIGLATLSVKSRKFRNAFAGKPSVIILNGKINYKEMMNQRYTLDDLLLHLRQRSIKSIDEVEYALLETNGKLSIFKYNLFKTKTSVPLPLIIDGEVQKKTLSRIKKSERWLMDEIRKKNLMPENIFYAFYKNTKLYIIKQTDV